MNMDIIKSLIKQQDWVPMTLAQNCEHFRSKRSPSPNHFIFEMIKYGKAYTLYISKPVNVAS